MLWNVFLSLEGLTKKAVIGLIASGRWTQIHSTGGSGAHNAVEVHKTQQLHIPEAHHLQLESPKLIADKDNKKDDESND